MDAFGRERVHIVTKEAMEHAPDTVMNEVHDFLGLCRPASAGEEAANAMSLTKENVRDGLVVPEGFGLEEADMLELSEAFQPWNEALYAFLDRDLGWPVRCVALPCLAGGVMWVGGGACFVHFRAHPRSFICYPPFSTNPQTSEESFVKAKLQFHRAVLFTAATPCEVRMMKQHDARTILRLSTLTLSFS